MSSVFRDPNWPLPAVDDRLVVPGTGYEIYDGKLVPVPPADEPHGSCNAQLAYLLAAHVGTAYAVAVDLLTRTSMIDDVAPDASVYLRARDPKTGGRQIEQLVFEIVSTQALSRVETKAAKLAERGVRRIFAVDLERARVLEWSRELEGWSVCNLRSALVDQVFAVPLPIESLLAASNDDVVARALLTKGSPVIDAQRALDRSEGRSEGLVQAVLLALELRGLVPDAAQRERLAGERDPARIERWMAAVRTCASVAALLAD